MSGTLYRERRMRKDLSSKGAMPRRASCRSVTAVSTIMAATEPRHSTRPMLSARALVMAWRKPACSRQPFSMRAISRSSTGWPGTRLTCSRPPSLPCLSVDWGELRTVASSEAATSGIATVPRSCGRGLRVWLGASDAPTERASTGVTPAGCGPPLPPRATSLPVEMWDSRSSWASAALDSLGWVGLPNRPHKCTASLAAMLSTRLIRYFARCTSPAEDFTENGPRPEVGKSRRASDATVTSWYISRSKFTTSLASMQCSGSR
mmetsp:Transcript_23321/g.63241  ORF Transcript_23321/g.63241 Transcript_23321/m.63241 type:complete len:263 (+) Transcript_23321:121-909(+)